MCSVLWGGGVISDDSSASDVILRPIKRGSSARELNERVVNALKDLHRLLELYAPSWYTEELHKKTAAALRAKLRSSPTTVTRPRLQSFGFAHGRVWAASFRRFAAWAVSGV